MSYELNKDREEALAEAAKKEAARRFNPYTIPSKPEIDQNVSENIQNVWKKNNAYLESFQAFQRILKLITSLSDKKPADVDWEMVTQYAHNLQAFAIQNAEISKSQKEIDNIAFRM